MIFDYQWTGDIDKLIHTIINYVLKYLKMHLIKHFKGSALLVKESFRKVKNFFHRKKNKDITGDDLQELCNDLNDIQSNPEFTNVISSLPDELEIADDTQLDESDTEEEQQNPKAFNFSGFKGPKYDASKGVLNFTEGITFKKPKVFKNFFESQPYDISKEQERLKKEKKRKATEELRERERIVKEQRKREREIEEKEAKELANTQRAKEAEEKSSKESRFPSFLDLIVSGVGQPQPLCARRRF